MEKSLNRIQGFTLLNRTDKFRYNFQQILIHLSHRQMEGFLEQTDGGKLLFVSLYFPSKTFFFDSFLMIPSLNGISGLQYVT